MHILLAAVALIPMLLFPIEGSSQTPHIQLQSITDERLTVPTFVTNSHDGTGRLFILEQRGRILVVQPQTRAATVFLDLTDKVLTSTERGLLGMTFHPQFTENREFFVDYTRKLDGAVIVARYKVSATNPNVAEPAETVLLNIPHSVAEHNGGMIEFGPDGYLYISAGDGGSSYDPANNAQNLDSLLGKILRIDVDSPAGSTVPYSSPPDNPFYGSTQGRDEIFAFGFRNPWRFSFDRATGEIYVGDVGQDTFEEIDVVESGGNYGWRVFEGTLCTNKGPAPCDPDNYIPPILQYGHSGRGGTCSITGGYVYRGNKQSLPFGAYIFGDYCTGQIYMLYRDEQVLLLDTTKQITSFGEDEEGEIYVVGGTVDRIVNPAGPFASTTSFELNPGGAVSFETHGTSDHVSVAHAQIQPDGDELRPSALAFIGFRKDGVLVSESAVPATTLIESGRVYVENGNGRDTGVALVNPDMARQAVVSFYFTDTEGNDFGESIVAIPTGGKIAAFLDEAPFYGPTVFTGTLTFDSSVPLSVIALEGMTNDRADFLTTTLPVVDLTTTNLSPILMPHVAVGGGWATDVLLVNPTDDRLSGVLRFVPAQPNAAASDSLYSIPPRSSRKLRIGVQTSGSVGMVKVFPDQNNAAPSIAALYTFTSGGTLISATGAAAMIPANNFDIYSELSGQSGTSGSIETGVAIASASDENIDVGFEFVSVEGKSTGISGVMTLAAHGQIHSSITELPGAENLPRPFQGTLRVSSSTPIAALAIRARYNERGDFLLSTTPPSPSDPDVDPQDEAYIPQVLDGGGYSTQIVIFGGTDEAPSSGNIYFFDPDGQPIDPPVE
jgi:glucose/arabinose dehydrogenase